MRILNKSLWFLLGLSLLLPASWIGSVYADDPGPVSSTPNDGSRLAGETIADATGIPSMPFSESSSTTGYHDDYDCNCASFKDVLVISRSPDVVYSYTPSTDEAITVDLCGASYDTKVYIYDEQQNVIACNDNSACTTRGLQSRLDSVVVVSNDQSYFIVVDGSNDESGSYDLDATLTPCPVECPVGALVEGEPPCGGGYQDQYNGGCHSSPPVYQRLEGQNGTPTATLCGKSCLHEEGFDPVGDEDWFEITAAGGTVSATVTPECPVSLRVFSADCGQLQPLEEITIRNCETQSLSFGAVAGTVYRLVVSPSGNDERPEFDYLLRVDGIQNTGYGACCFRNAACRILDAARCSALRGTYAGDGTLCTPNPCHIRGFDLSSPIGGDPPAETVTWGQIKSLYR